MHKIDINLGKSSYAVLIEPGLLPKTGEYLQKIDSGRQIAIISDTTVAQLYGSTVEQSLIQYGFSTHLLSFAPGEQSKDISTIFTLCREFITKGLDRSSTVLALGGGVVGDIAGFAAAIFLRGLRYVHVPTTLLSFCDSSVGGKVGINFDGTKNLIGSFYQPKSVLIDPDVLKTLPERELVSGLAEVIKTGLIGDDILYRKAVDNTGAILSLTDMNIVSDIIYRSVLKKAEIVGKDEKESGLRRTLNFGHTLGHGIEAASNGKLRHGEAVLYGMAAAVRLSYTRGKLSEDSYNSLISDMIRIPVPFNLQEVSFDMVLPYIKKDKKTIDNRIRFILLSSVGNPYEEETLTDNDLRKSFEYIQQIFQP